jgi:hypothetical protein
VQGAMTRIAENHEIAPIVVGDTRLPRAIDMVNMEASAVPSDVLCVVEAATFAPSSPQLVKFLWRSIELTEGVLPPVLRTESIWISAPIFFLVAGMAQTKSLDFGLSAFPTDFVFALIWMRDPSGLSTLVCGVAILAEAMTVYWFSSTDRTTREMNAGRDAALSGSIILMTTVA